MKLSKEAQDTIRQMYDNIKIAWEGAESDKQKAEEIIEECFCKLDEMEISEEIHQKAFDLLAQGKSIEEVE